MPPGIEDLIPGYMENRHKEVAELRGLIEAGSFERVGEIAHRMIGVGTPYGFDFVTEQARVIRRAATTGDASALAQLVDDLDNYLRVVKITTG